MSLRVNELSSFVGKERRKNRGEFKVSGLHWLVLLCLSFRGRDRRYSAVFSCGKFNRVGSVIGG